MKHKDCLHPDDIRGIMELDQVHQAMDVLLNNVYCSNAWGGLVEGITYSSQGMDTLIINGVEVILTVFFSPEYSAVSSIPPHDYILDENDHDAVVCKLGYSEDSLVEYCRYSKQNIRSHWTGTQH